MKIKTFHPFVFLDISSLNIAGCWHQNLSPIFFSETNISCEENLERCSRSLLCGFGQFYHTNKKNIYINPKSIKLILYFVCANFPRPPGLVFPFNLLIYFTFFLVNSEIIGLSVKWFSRFKKKSFIRKILVVFWIFLIFFF